MIIILTQLTVSLEKTLVGLNEARTIRLYLENGLLVTKTNKKQEEKRFLKMSVGCKRSDYRIWTDRND